MTAPGHGIEPAYAATMPAPQGGALPTGLEWQALERMAETLANSDVIPYRLKRKPADVAVVLLAAREYGIPPLMALAKLPVVNGTPAPMGELMVALVLRAGHSIRVTVEGEGGPVEDMVAVCTTKRRDEAEPDVLRFTFREAVSAGLVSVKDGKPHARDQKGNPTPWEQYPTNMLRWRAVANACRLRFPDVLLGLSYLPEELGAVVDADGAPVVEAHRAAPPAGSLEQRTAQDTATRLAEFEGDPALLDNVLKHAQDNGYADQLVDYAGERIRLDAAIDAKATALRARVVDAVVEPVSAPQETPAPAPAPEAPAEPAEAPTAPPAADREDPLADLVYFASTVDDVDVIRELYRERKADLDTLVVAPAALELGFEAKLGAVLMALGARLREGKGPLVLPGPDDDAPTAVPADGWPEQPDAHPDELPLP